MWTSVASMVQKLDKPGEFFKSANCLGNDMYINRVSDTEFITNFGLGMEIREKRGIVVNKLFFFVVTTVHSSPPKLIHPSGGYLTTFFI